MAGTTQTKISEVDLITYAGQAISAGINNKAGFVTWFRTKLQKSASGERLGSAYVKAKSNINVSSARINSQAESEIILYIIQNWKTYEKTRLSKTINEIEIDCKSIGYRCSENWEKIQNELNDITQHSFNILNGTPPQSQNSSHCREVATRLVSDGSIS